MNDISADAIVAMLQDISARLQAVENRLGIGDQKPKVQRVVVDIPKTKLLSCRQVDRLYRLRKGTAAGAFHARKLPGQRRGRAIYVSAKRADLLWGVD